MSSTPALPCHKCDHSYGKHSDPDAGPCLVVGCDCDHYRYTTVNAARTLLKNPPRDDAVEHPAHYTKHPSGVECIQITEHMNFNVGNAVKYLWRNEDKGSRVQDLKKARWYVDREIARLTSDGDSER